MTGGRESTDDSRRGKPGKGLSDGRSGVSSLEFTCKASFIALSITFILEGKHSVDDVSRRAGDEGDEGGSRDR